MSFEIMFTKHPVLELCFPGLTLNTFFLDISSDKYSTGKDKKRETPALEPVSVDSAFCCFENLSSSSPPRNLRRVLHFV